MTKQEMVQRLGLTEKEHDEIIQGFAKFFNALNDNQKRAVNNWMPAREEIARAFGPDVTVEELKRLSNLEYECIGVAAVALFPGPGHHHRH